MEIQQAWVTIATAEFERSQAFYRSLFPQSLEIPGQYAEFVIAGLKLGLYKPRSTEANATAFPIMSVCLQVADLGAAIAQLSELGYPVGDIIQASHGREVYAYDPDGNRLVLYQPKH